MEERECPWRNAVCSSEAPCPECSEDEWTRRHVQNCTKDGFCEVCQSL